MIINGIPNTNRHVSHGKKNWAPPCFHVRYGKRQKLPSPIAEPIAARMKVNRPFHRGRSSGFSFSSLLIQQRRHSGTSSFLSSCVVIVLFNPLGFLKIE